MAGTKENDRDSILDLFNNATKITISDVIENIRICRTSAGRMLEELVQLGKIEKVGKGRGSSYIRREEISSGSCHFCVNPLYIDSLSDFLRTDILQ